MRRPTASVAFYDPRQISAEQSTEIAHLKMTLSLDVSLGGNGAIINLVRNDFVPELSVDLDAPIESGQLIINLRA